MEKKLKKETIKNYQITINDDLDILEIIKILKNNKL